jgi:hypothetical protein
MWNATGSEVSRAITHSGMLNSGDCRNCIHDAAALVAARNGNSCAYRGISDPMGHARRRFMVPQLQKVSQLSAVKEIAYGSYTTGSQGHAGADRHDGCTDT